MREATAQERSALRRLRDEMAAELTGRILPFWMAKVVDERLGGFVGLITDDGAVVANSPKGSIVNARILWTFAAAYRALGDERYRRTADRALDYVRAHFVDPEHGGVYWMCDGAGRPLDARKHVYAQSFAIYALSEYAIATGDQRALREAIELFRLVERHAHDAVHGGYQEAFSRDWVLLDDVRLSEEDADERKSMNTHLHVLEAYTNLYRAWPDALLRERLHALVELFVGSIIGEGRGHVTCFFDEDWTPKSDLVSYGHDIETSWLLAEAAEVLGDEALRERVRGVSLRVASAVLAEGVDAKAGGLFNERLPSGVVDTDKEWWPQAEAIVGFVAAYEASGREEFLDAAVGTWEFTKRYFLDIAHGDWHRRVSRDGELRPGHEKVGPWKCPYHTGRACLEVMARVAAGSAVGAT